MARVPAALLSVAMALPSAVLGQAAVNPLRGDIQVHDPVLTRSGGTYFLFHTGTGISMKTSTDRIRWRAAGGALPVLPAWHAEAVPGNTGHLWAPDIHYRDGKFWLYYSVSTFGSRNSAIGLATAPALEPAPGATRWTDQGLVTRTTEASDHNAIDPNVVLDAAGTPWLSYGSFWTGIKLIRLDPATGKPAPAAGLLSLASRSAGIEAPFIFRRGPWYYLFVSFDACCKGAASTYNLRVGRSAQVTGPYADSRGVPLLGGGGDLLDGGDARWKGPGHNGLFEERDTVFLVNHAYDADDQGRATLWIRPLYWTPAGWPTLDPRLGSTVGASIAVGGDGTEASRPWPRYDASGRARSRESGTKPVFP